MKRTFLLATASALLPLFPAGADTTINSTDKYAYGANIGWINLAGDGTNGVVVGEYYLSGFAYGANVGWINFGDGSPDNGTAYSNNSATDFGVNQDGVGNLSGMAYGANIGWINFGTGATTDPDRPRIDLSTGEFAGFAYGANVGWINLGAGYLATDTLFCADGDGDGISDAWEIENFGDTTTADGSSDQDGDGASDKDEYVGSSDPNNSASFLRIVSQMNSPDSPTTREVTIEFSSSPTRLYQIALSTDLQTFSDSGLGTFAPSADSTTTKTFTGNIDTQYYRVVAVKPLQP